MKVLLALKIIFVSFALSQAQDNGGRIVNGQYADVRDFPHVLALHDQGRFFCGASVISDFYALTAAHCLDLGTPPNLITLRGDSTNRLIGGQLWTAAAYTNHPLYRRIQLTTSQRIWDYDVSVIRVTTQFSGTYITPTILPSPCADDCCGTCENTVITLAGWGRIETGALPIDLRMLNQTIVNRQGCSPFWENQITDRMFCVTADFFDSCDGDSGSGILLLDRVSQVGYVSFGSMVCGDGSAPAVYGRIEHPSIRNFIRDISGV